MDRGGRSGAFDPGLRPRADEQSAADGLVPQDRLAAARARHLGGHGANDGRAQPSGAARRQLSPDELERAAERWIAGYFLARHLVRTRDWVVELDPDADLALRIAALTHDIERHVPGGPRFDPARQASDEAGYLLEHSIRSAQIVGAWLAEMGHPRTSAPAHQRRAAHHASRDRRLPGSRPPAGGGLALVPRGERSPPARLGRGRPL